MNVNFLLRAHSFMRVEHPTEVWRADVEEERFILLLGEMIAFGLSRGNALAELTLNAANIEAENDDGLVARGEYVALSVSGKGDWRPEWVRRPYDIAPGGAYSDLGRVLTVSGAVFAYARHLGGSGSVTVFVRRLADRASVLLRSAHVRRRLKDHANAPVATTGTAHHLRQC